MPKTKTYYSNTNSSNNKRILNAWPIHRNAWRSRASVCVCVCRKERQSSHNGKNNQLERKRETRKKKWWSDTCTKCKHTVSLCDSKRSPSRSPCAQTMRTTHILLLLIKLETIESGCDNTFFSGANPFGICFNNTLLSSFVWAIFDFFDQPKERHY